MFLHMWSLNNLPEDSHIIGRNMQKVTVYKNYFILVHFVGINIMLYMYVHIYILHIYLFIFRFYVVRSHMLQNLKKFGTHEPYNRTAVSVKEMSLLACPQIAADLSYTKNSSA